MPTNLALDDRLLNEARRIGGREFIQRRQRLDLVALMGRVDYDSTYDYKKERRRR
jgi:hypothetical protein